MIMATILQTWEKLSPAATQKRGGRNNRWALDKRGSWNMYVNQYWRIRSSEHGMTMFNNWQMWNWARFNMESRYNFQGIETEEL